MGEESDYANFVPALISQATQRIPALEPLYSRRPRRNFPGAALPRRAERGERERERERRRPTPT